MEELGQEPVSVCLNTCPILLVLACGKVFPSLCKNENQKHIPACVHVRLQLSWDGLSFILILGPVFYKMTGEKTFSFFFLMPSLAKLKTGKFVFIFPLPYSSIFWSTEPKSRNHCTNNDIHRSFTWPSHYFMFLLKQTIHFNCNDPMNSHYYIPLFTDEVPEAAEL